MAVALPKRVGCVGGLGRDRSQDESAFEERNHLAQVLGDEGESDDDVGEGITAGRTLVGVGEVFELTAFGVAVGGFDGVAEPVGS